MGETPSYPTAFAVSIPSAPRRRRSVFRALAPPFLLVVLGLMAYAGTLKSPFVFDDQIAIVKNAHVRRLWPLAYALSAPRQSSAAGRPVVSLSLALNHAVSGLDVWSYHVLNLVVHLAGALLLFGIVRRTLAGARFRPRVRRAAVPLAWTTAAVWGLHPLQTESVTYVIQRSESMMGFFFLLTLYAFIRHVAAAPSRGWAILAVASCALGMGCKEVMIACPVVVLLYAVLFLDASLADALKRRGRLLLALAGTWIILAVLMASGPRSESAGFHLPKMTAGAYARTQFGVILHYLRLSFWPHPLCLDYRWPIARTFWQIAPGFIVLAVLGGATAWALRRRRPAGFAGAWFFLILAPTSSFVPLLDPAFEHRMYLPLAAICVSTVVGSWAVVHRSAHVMRWTSGRRRIIAAAACSSLAVVMVFLTYRRNADYRTAVTIWAGVVAQRPGNMRAHNNLGTSLYKEGKLDEAERHLRTAVELLPDYADAHYNLGIVLGNQNRLNQAIAEFRTAVRIEPRSAEYHYNLGIALHAEGHVQEAIDQLGEAISLRPDYFLAHQALGLAQSAVGRHRDAVPHFREAMRLMPESPIPVNSLSWILATTPDATLRDPRQAMQFAERACRFTDFKDAGALDSMAAALAAAGQFERAQETARSALVLLGENASPKLAGDIRARIGLYRQRKPYVEPARAASAP